MLNFKDLTVVDAGLAGPVAVVLVIQLFFLTTFVSGCCACKATVKMADVVETGRIIPVEISSDCEEKKLILKFAGTNFRCFSNGRPGVYEAFMTAPLNAKPGPAEVKLFHDNRVVCLKKVRVKKKRYPEEHLKVARKMVNFRPDVLKRVLEDQKAVRKACRAGTPERYWHTPFIWPVDSRISSPFGLRRFFNGQPRSPHSGIDMRAAEGTPLRAANDGRVALVRDCYLSGNTVVIDHGAGLFTLYAHLSRVTVKQGEMVKRGDIIGLAGATGRVTGPHLHWGASLSGIRFDPESLMEVAGSKPEPSVAVKQ